MYYRDDFTQTQGTGTSTLVGDSYKNHPLRLGTTRIKDVIATVNSIRHQLYESSIIFRDYGDHEAFFHVEHLDVQVWFEIFMELPIDKAKAALVQSGFTGISGPIPPA